MSLGFRGMGMGCGRRGEEVRGNGQVSRNVNIRQEVSRCHESQQGAGQIGKLGGLGTLAGFEIRSSQTAVQGIKM